MGVQIFQLPTEYAQLCSSHLPHLWIPIYFTLWLRHQFLICFSWLEEIFTYIFTYIKNHPELTQNLEVNWYELQSVFLVFSTQSSSIGLDWMFLAQLQEVLANFYLKVFMYTSNFLVSVFNILYW